MAGGHLALSLLLVPGTSVISKKNIALAQKSLSEEKMCVGDRLKFTTELQITYLYGHITLT